jgi:Mg2+ and Co2+ transporter CorA
MSSNQTERYQLLTMITVTTPLMISTRYGMNFEAAGIHWAKAGLVIVWPSA